MLNIADTLHHWCREARPFALATVVDVSGSAPLPVGTALAVDADGNAVGSISGGCVEGSGVRTVPTGPGTTAAPPHAPAFGYSDDDAFAVGLTCGGEIDVLVQRVEPADRAPPRRRPRAVVAGRPAAVAHVVDGPDELLGRTLHVPDDGGATTARWATRARTGRSWRKPARCCGRAAPPASRSAADARHLPRTLTVLVHAHASRPRMLIFGAVDFAAALSQAGRFLGYRVTVCDARPVFATPARFPHADEVVVDWPHRYLGATEVDARTAVCVLTHDAKFDIPLLRLALDPPRRLRRRDGLPTHPRATASTSCARPACPRTNWPGCTHRSASTSAPVPPRRQPISITAEIIAYANRGTGLPLSQGAGPIHRPLVRSRADGRTALDEVPARAGAGVGR